MNPVENVLTGVYNQKVLLLLLVNVAYASKKKTCDRILYAEVSETFMS